MGNRIISISRQFGSGGHEVAVKTADLLGIRVYERELIRLACEYGELSEKTLSPSDEKATNPYLFQTVHEGNHHVLRGKPTSEVLFALQSHEIRRIARHEECVFVGRCADYVLRGEDVRLLTVFVAAPDEHRIQRKMAQEKLTRDQAIRLIRKMDKQRRKYYESYTHKAWGAPEGYDLYLDTGALSTAAAAAVISERVRKLLKIKELSLERRLFFFAQVRSALRHTCRVMRPPFSFPRKKTGVARPKERRSPLQASSSKSCNACRIGCLPSSVSKRLDYLLSSLSLCLRFVTLTQLRSTSGFYQFCFCMPRRHCWRSPRYAHFR